MVTKLFCDRCGNEFTNYQFAIVFREHGKETELSKEFCMDCAKDIKKMVVEKKRKLL